MIGILAERKLLNKISLPPLDEEIKPGWSFWLEIIFFALAAKYPLKFQNGLLPAF